MDYCSDNWIEHSGEEMHPRGIRKACHCWSILLRVIHVGHADSRSKCSRPVIQELEVSRHYRTVHKNFGWRKRGFSVWER